MCNNFTKVTPHATCSSISTISFVICIHKDICSSLCPSMKLEFIDQQTMSHASKGEKLCLSIYMLCHPLLLSKEDKNNVRRREKDLLTQ